MLRHLLVGSLCAVTFACSVGATDDAASASALDAPRRGVTVCFSGAYHGSDPFSTIGNPELGALCEKMPGLVHVGALPFFTYTQNADTALDTVIAALDTNRDGKISALDEAVDINVVGFSWGGFNAMDFIRAWAASSKVAPDSKEIARYFAIDPFRPDALVMSTVSLHVPKNVQSFWELRHTVAPADDCSIGSAMGPYTGRVPLCFPQTTCTDYDYSLATTETFDGKLGSALGHCDMPGATSDAVLALTDGTKLPPMPPTRPVGRDRDR